MRRVVEHLQTEREHLTDEDVVQRLEVRMSSEGKVGGLEEV